MTTPRRKFRPSQASHWGNCAAFHRFTANRPEQPDTDPAREGTCAAYIAERMLNSEPVNEGDTHPGNGWVVDDKMVSYVTDYVDLVRSFGGTVAAEKFVTASTEPLIEGTLDSSVSVLALEAGLRILRIIDLKYGFGIVEVTTEQLVCYAWGEFLQHPPGTFDRIELCIYQPRAFHRDGIFRSRTITPEQLHAEFTKLWLMAVEGEKPDSVATPGAHCRHCPVASSCSALVNTVYHLVEKIQSREQRDMTPIELSKELDFVTESEKIIKAHFSAIKDEAEARSKRENIPNWKSERTQGNRVFSVKDGVLIHALTGVNPWKSVTVTPAELERRGADKEVVKTITTRAETGSKLVRINSGDIAAIFEKD